MPRDSAARLMLVMSRLQDRAAGGRELLSRMNHDALREINGERLLVFELPRIRVRGLRSIVSAFRGHIDGLNDAVIGEALQAIRTENVDKVFVDGSNLGALVKAVKKRLLHVQVITFFHNVEARFFLGALRQSGTLRSLAVLMVNYLAERMAVRYSDKIICLSERDSRLLQRIYGRAATHVSPLSMQDQLSTERGFNEFRSAERFALFVGGEFYANRAGIAWFVKHVVPRIHIKTCIVGRGLEDLKPELERAGKVEVAGAVDSLAGWYRDAHFVIAPIFDGSGMKTKVAEALMHGKRIIGTPEAFSGYESIADRAGWVCASADDFVAAIARAQEEIVASFDPALRALYEETYSYPAARSRLARVLDSVR